MAPLLQNMRRAWRLWVLLALLCLGAVGVYAWVRPQSLSFAGQALGLRGKTPAGSNSFLGQFKQVQISTATKHYAVAGLAVAYPASWQAAPTPTLPGLSGEAVGFTPPGAPAPEHVLYLSGNAQSAIAQAERKAGRTLDATAQDGGVQKLSYSGSKDKNDKVTYYLFPTFALRVHGPGQEQLDAAAQLIVRSLVQPTATP